MSLAPKTSAALPASRDIIRELDLVTLAEPVRSDEGCVVPAGTVGTVVAIWAGGSGYEVEFIEPVAALATVAASQIASHRSFDG